MRADDLPPNKRWRFHPDAMERFENEKEFLDRQLNETKYLSRIARSYLAHLYNEKAEGSLRVRAIPGKLTAMLRGKWGLSALHRDHNLAGGDFEDGPARKNRDDQRHHAIDAFVVAMTDQQLLQRISKLNSGADRKRLIEAIPEPWPGFTPDALREQFDRVVVAYKPDHGTPGLNGKTTGALHNDTAYWVDWTGQERKLEGGLRARPQVKSFLMPKDMDAALQAVRDTALRNALIEAWQQFKKSEPEKGASAVSPKKMKNAAGSLCPARGNTGRRAERPQRQSAPGANDRGTQRHVQIKDQKDRKAVQSLQARRQRLCGYLPVAEWTLDGGRHSPFRCQSSRFRSGEISAPTSAAKKVMRLHIDDMVALNESGPKAHLAGRQDERTDHHACGAFRGRRSPRSATRTRTTCSNMLEKSASSLRDMGLRKIGVDEIGRMTDPGPRLEMRA